MLSSPRRSPRRHALSDRTNDLSVPSSPTRDAKGKRRADEYEGPKKRVKLHEIQDEASEGRTDDQDVEMADVMQPVRFPRPQRNDVYGALRALRSGDPRARRSIFTPSTHTLEAFVSSNKADIIWCHSLQSDSFLTPPYACAFSHDSKRGKSAVLAIATEEGTVDILDTRRRREWDPVPSKTSLEVHQSGIFDIKWSPCDTLIATASGDKTVRITDPHSPTRTSLQTLRGGHSTFKCVAWDPRHTNLLISGGRDGQISLWDLRDRRSGQAEHDQNSSMKPVMVIPCAHEAVPGKPTKKGRTLLASKSVTSLIYLPGSDHQILSSGSADGIIRKWDLRYTLASPSKSTKKPAAIAPIDEAVIDFTTVPSDSPTAAHTFSPRRARGICSLALGAGPTVGQVFALGNDSRVHTYNASGAFGTPLSVPQVTKTYSHRHMATNSFYVRVAVSPCGQWLASGGANGSAFLFDVTGRSGLYGLKGLQGVELKGQEGEVGALDWSADSLATCADDGSVRIWRPDLAKYEQCLQDPEEAAFDWTWGRA